MSNDETQANYDQNKTKRWPRNVWAVTESNLAHKPRRKRLRVKKDVHTLISTDSSKHKKKKRGDTEEYRVRRNQQTKLQRKENSDMHSTTQIEIIEMKLVTAKNQQITGCTRWNEPIRVENETGDTNTKQSYGQFNTAKKQREETEGGQLPETQK